MKKVAWGWKPAAVLFVLIVIAGFAGAATDRGRASGFKWLEYVSMAVCAIGIVQYAFGRPRLPHDRRYYRRVTVYGAKMSGINAVSTLHDRVGLLVLAVFAGDAQVGVLSVAIAGREVVLLAAQALALSAFHAVGVGQREDASTLTPRVVRHAMLLAALGSIALVPATIILLGPVVGPGYGDVPQLIALLAPSTVALAALYQLFQYFEVRVASAAVTLKISGSALVANAILSTALAPLWGASGVALGTSIAYVVAIVVAFRNFCRASGAPARDLVPGREEIRDYVDMARPYAARLRRKDRA